MIARLLSLLADNVFSAGRKIFVLTVLIGITVANSLFAQKTETTYDSQTGRIIVNITYDSKASKPGEGTFTIPAGVTEVTVEAWGGGGGGGSRSSNGRAGGGGGGAYAKSTLSVTPGTVYNYTVGGGGGSNTAGGNSRFYIGTVDYVKAAGGSGGSNDDTSGATGGTIANSVGDVKYAGGNGGNQFTESGIFGSTYSGGGGGGAGTSGDGKNANGNSGGSATDEYGGAGGNGHSNNDNGNEGALYGGGGSGATRSGVFVSGTRAGGKGGDGLIRISYTPSYEHFYSYKSGAWNDPTTWTHDPSGTLQVGEQIPGDNSYIYILSGRNVSLNSNVNINFSSVEIKNGGILNLGTNRFINNLNSLSGEGTLRLASVNFPVAGDNNFVKAGGGATEYTNSSNFTLPNSQTEYNNLVIASPAIATQLHNLTINGNLHIKTGTYRISDNSTDNSTARYELTIEGNVLVDNGASLTVGTRRTTTTGTPGNITGGNASPFIGYYYNHSHTIIIKGDLTNNGTVRFTNMPYPIFNSFPTANNQTGMATVYFQGVTDNMLTCNGTTDFYNLVLDKGNDQTYKLTVYSSHYHNFRLFGVNTLGGLGGGANPDLRKALWIRTGTLELTGQTVIPSLSEGGGSEGSGGPNTDYYIPANGALVLNGPDVIVLGTADNYSEVNAAYGVNGGTGNVQGVNITANSSFSIYGKFQVKDGYFSARESGGLIFWALASAELEINGGYVDAKQLRAAHGANGLASYTQTGGTLALRGQFVTNYSTSAGIKAMGWEAVNTLSRRTNGLETAKTTFNINDENNVFAMSGGKIQIFDALSGGGIEISSSEKNINVTGGTIEFSTLSNSSTAYHIKSNAPFGNLILNRKSGSNGPVARVDNSELILLNDITVESGTLNANGRAVTIGGNLTINSGATYTPGSNITTFNGGTHQIINNNGTITSGFNNLIVDKKGGELRLAGASSYTVLGGFELLQGTFHDKGRTLNVAGNIINSGIHKGDAGGGITLTGTDARTIGGNGKGVFNNLTLNNNNGNAFPISLTSDMAINGVLTFSQNKGLNIGEYNLKLGAAASISGATGANNRYIRTNGKVGDGGLTFIYDNFSNKTFPIGASYYMPATIGFSSAPTKYGTITIVPVDDRHPLITNTSSLKTYWRVKSEGFTGYEGKVKHLFIFNTNQWGTGTQANYLPAVYSSISNSWSFGSTSNINVTDRTISDWTSPTQSADILNGDYTAGIEASLTPPRVFYSITTGNWNSGGTWSLVGHSGAVANTTPTASDVVIIGNGHTVTLTATANSASLMIAETGVLNVQTNTGSDFGTIFSHPSGKNGTIRVALDVNGNSTYSMPSGDFSEFHNNLGTIEFYSLRTSGTTRTYTLPNIAKYGNLKVSPNSASTIVLSNNDLLVLGDLIVSGAGSTSYFNLGSGNNSYRNIKVEGNINIQGGQMRYFGGNGNTYQKVVVEKDVIIGNSNDAEINRNSDSTANHSLEIKGSLINNGTANFSNIPVTFSGSANATVSGSSGSITFSRLTVNKGSSQTPKLTIDYSGTLTTDANNWLFLQNGTLVYKRNSASNFTITTSSSFTIPATAGLWVESSGSGKVIFANANSNANDLFLNGKLTVVSGSVEIGNTGNNNQDIEYSGGGSSSIEVRGGSLTVNGQIRRNPATTSGVLSYVQSGGNVTINGKNSNTTNAKLEVLNAGSRFNMSGGTLTIGSGDGVTVGDLYIRPASSTVTGGTIVLNSGSNYIIDSDVALYNMEVNGTAKVMTSALTLKGYLTISSGSVLDMNDQFDIPLTVGGNFTNNGTYRHHKNLTTFNGVVHKLSGTTQTSFYNLKVRPVTSFTVEQDVSVGQDLEIASGRFIVGNKTIIVTGHLRNNGIYESDATAGGVLLTNGTVQHQISGNGTFGRLELNNSLGVRAGSDITFDGNLVLTDGVFNINKYLLTLGENANVQSLSFNSDRMISSDGVYSNTGVRKYYAQSNYLTARDFIYPMGVGSKYTPITLTVKSIGSGGYIRINTVNEKHPSTLSPYKVLDYYWDVESTGIKEFQGALKFNYHNDDVRDNATDEAAYVAARLLSPGTSWEKASEGAGTDNVDETNNNINFIFNGTDNLSGEYTAGIDANIPDKVPTYISNKSGVWSDKTIWTPVGDSPECSDGGPNGVVVIIAEGHDVTLNKDYIFAYKTTITGRLKVDKNYIGHNLGAISGEGILYIEESVLPAGRYSTFFDSKGNSTLELGGNDNYNIITDLFTELPNLVVSGTGSRFLPAESFTVHKSLAINGGVLDNSSNNNKLIINGIMVRNGGQFNSGTGANATVVFNGKSMQVVGNFVGTSVFNNLEINNSAGLTLTDHVEVKNQLKLTKGIINTSDATLLKITNSSQSNTVSPSTITVSSYVDGPMVKRINSGNEFTFPVGKNGVLGNMLKVSATSATDDWTVEYFNPNDTYTQFNTPLTYVNSKDRWSIRSASNKSAKVTVSWSQSSDITPQITANGVNDIKLSNYNSGNWELITSTASGSNLNGTIISNDKLAFSATEKLITSATINSVTAKAKFEPDVDMCGVNVGIPVAFTSSGTITLPYKLTYTIDGVENTAYVNSLPYRLPTTVAGEYKLLYFHHTNSTLPGVVDDAVVTIYELPTTAVTTEVTADCGATTVVLSANEPIVGAGLWSVVIGDGGSFEDPTIRNTTFRGTNGSVYTLRWTITNGVCESSSDVVVALPLAAEQPNDFIAYATDVCGGSEVTYTVPLDPAVSYLWSYSGAGATITGSGNSVKVSFENQAESGIISVRAKNDCNTSAAREIAITVNPIYDVVLTADFTGEVCVNNTITFTATPDNGTWVEFDFVLNNVSSQSKNSNTFTASTLSDGDKVYVIATTDRGCEVISNEITVAVSTTPGLWTGSNGNNWFDAANWCDGSVPTSGNNVTINSTTNVPEVSGTTLAQTGNLTINSNTLTVKPGAKMTVNGDIAVNGTGALIIENNLNGLTGASGTDIEPASFINHGNINGSVTIRTNFPKLPRNWYLGMPVTGNSSAYFDKGNFSMWTYNHANNKEEWLGVPNSATLQNDMTTYVVNNGTGADQTVDVVGTLVNITQTMAMSVTAKNGFNLVANPFTAYLDPTKLNLGITENGMEPTIWYRTVNAQRSYTFETFNTKEGITLPIGSSDLIAPMQGFWVRARETGKVLEVRKDMLQHPDGGNNPQLKSAKLPANDVLYLELSNSKTSDQLAIAMRASGNDSYSNNDSEKRLSAGSVPDFYSVKSGKYVAINIVPDAPATTTVNLGCNLANGANSNLKISALNLSSFMPGTEVFLEDRLTGDVVNLRNNGEYSFESATGAINSRFVLTFSRVSTDIDDSVTAGKPTIRIYGNDGKAIVNIDSELIVNGANIRVFTLSGALVSIHKVSDTRSEISLPDASAIYVVEAEAGGVVKREKIVK